MGPRAGESDMGHVFKASQRKNCLEICQYNQILACTLVTKMMVIYGNLLVKLSFLILF